MFGLRKLFKGEIALPEALKSELESWQNMPVPVLDEAHFHVRYVVLDIASSGLDPDKDRLLGIAATAVSQAGTLLPSDACYVDLSLDSDEEGRARQWIAFLHFIGKSPLVAYHEPYAGAFLRQAIKQQLGIDFEAQWLDLAWLLPSMFEEKAHSVLPLDRWIELLGLEAGLGRRDAMENTLLLARLFQMLLRRASAKGVDTAAALIGEAQASSFLRRTH